jgi:transcriptional regulator with XRE-family HTH domain
MGLNLLSSGVLGVGDNNMAVKELIEALRIKHGSTLKPASLSELAKIYGVSRQNLAYWMKNTPERSRMFGFIEKAAKDLEWDDAKAFKKTVKARK